MNFIHLHNHTQYSQLDGYGTAEQYLDRAKELNFSALAMTDHGNIDGAIRWQKESDKVGVKPIIGCELYVVPDMNKKEKGEKRGHLTVLVKGIKGWQILLKMLSKANIYGFYGRPRVDYKTILSSDPEGLKDLIFLTGCGSTFLLLPGGVDFLDMLIGYNVNLWLEVMPHNIDIQKQTNEICLDLFKSRNLQLVATNDCHYVLSEQAVVQEVLLAVQRNNTKWNDPKRWKFGFDGIHLRSSEEMIQAFEKQGVLSKRQYSLAMMNTVKIAEQCWDFRIPKQVMSLPETRYEKNVSMNTIEVLGSCCQSGIEKLFLGELPIEYLTRYKEEMEVIKSKDFGRYYLLVYEIIEFCKEREIPVGPGRGSAAGSLLCYLLGITSVDPLKYGLLFERFISPARNDFPDIDLDFPPDKVPEIKKHLEEEYGQYNVAGISTFMTMKSRGAIRDVGRIFELPFKTIDGFAKAIKDSKGNEGIIVNAGNTSIEGRQFKNQYPEQFKLMCDLEGQVRNSGQHPAGIIVSGDDLRDGIRANLCLRRKSLIVNWDMKDCEYAGLIKLDILKLTTLSVIGGCVDLIRENHKSMKAFKIEDLDLDDQKVFKMLSEGNTVGVFQMAGYACTKLCKEMKIDSFNDMAACVALARPGPLESGMAEKYVKRKHGEQWEPMHPAYEAITAETYGVMAYQEQMMRAVVDLAGMSKGNAEDIRKVIGKKRDPSEFEPYRLAFLNGCKKQKTLNEKEAQEFWEGLLGWANYGFCKAHAVCYALLGYQTAWLKVNYSMEFICAFLTWGDEKEKQELINLAHDIGLIITAPKVGKSHPIRWIIQNKILYAPFAEIKGVGVSQAEKCCSIPQVKTKLKGFFNISNSVTIPQVKGKLREQLEAICAFDPDPKSLPKKCLDYFSFDLRRREQNGKRLGNGL